MAEIEKHLQEEVMTSEDACAMLGITRHYLYQLTSTNKIPHYKPLGKRVYFKRSEMMQWLEKSKVITKNN